MSICRDQSTKGVDVDDDHRPFANFNPSIWGDSLLLNHDQVTGGTKEEEGHRELEVKLNEQFHDLLVAYKGKGSDKDPLELLSFIDNVERLGVAYRFPLQIQEALQTIFDTTQNNIVHQEDLHLTSLRFRILRQHGFYVPTDVFKVYKEEEKGSFKEVLASNVQGMLSLYEASQLRVHEENILDEALEFTTRHLKSLNDIDLSPPLSLLLPRSLNVPLHKAMPRLESRHYISIYEHDPMHHPTLLKFAKLDFNLLQSIYKEELLHLSRWWKELDLSSDLPFPIRDRVVEGYFWGLGIFYEPQMSLARDIFLKMFKVASVLDDLYDAYGTLEELEPFEKALKRWDINCIDELPEYMKLFFRKYVGVYKEVETSLVGQGRSHLIHYAIQENKELCEAYVKEARWRHNKHTPTYDEYMNEAALLSYGNNWAIAICFLGMGDDASEEAFQWIRRNPLVVEGGGKHGRLMNDMVSRTFERERWHIPSAVECYMRENGTTKEETHKEFYQQLEGVLKDLNQAILRASDDNIPRAWLVCQLNLNRAVTLVYKDEDSYTFPEKAMKGHISYVLIDPIPL